MIAVFALFKVASMTAEWENQLLAHEKGSRKCRFMEGIKNLITMVLNGCDLSLRERQRFRSTDSIGTCPVCGSLMFESQKNFYCSDKDCNFACGKKIVIWKVCAHKIDKRMAAELLKNGRVFCRNLYSEKKKKTFEAELVLQIKDGRAHFWLGISKINL